MPETKGNGHFQIFTAIFAAMQGSPTDEDREPWELEV
jgi:hypothetical protein